MITIYKEQIYYPKKISVISIIKSAFPVSEILFNSL